MKILCVCSHGNNRSVHLAHQLKYWNNDVIACGIDRNSKDTLEMLYKWADKIICTEDNQIIPEEYKEKYMLAPIGPDIYKRPFNEELLKIVKKYLQDNKQLFKN